MIPRMQLLNFLRPEHVPYHVRAVHWVWTLQDCTKQYHVEALISRSLATSSTKYDYQAFESFGVLWRLTGEHQHACCQVNPQSFPISQMIQYCLDFASKYLCFWFLIL